MISSIITFDYDGCIGDHFDGSLNVQKKIIRDWVMRLLRRGYEVYFVTRRFGPGYSGQGITNEHVEVLKLAKELGIEEDKVIFTNREWKYKTLGKINSIIHIDDDIQEKELIEKFLPNTKCIWIEKKEWEKELIELLKEHDHVKIWLSNPENILRLGFAAGGLLLLFLLL